MVNGKHSCPGPSRCICVTCKHDSEDCCIDRKLPCPFWGREQVCEGYEKEDGENDGEIYGKWISARDAVPEDQEEVLVCTLSKNGVRNIDKGYWSIDQFIHRGRATVTHWMPLPPMPEDLQ